ncbi:DUF4157 domain-containing protein [Pseudomaricurvus alcaniphilus]|uniref:eCIS core domain-containing protein n=1 Tax=Pseudomaricurvus alcaniphilus TaxID=1166482 RepID=UPI00140813A3|nr:DUF4157 domain-containing protein [Pseudomaricurvus alcaniphilus]NHN38339.1 DUF4157 domain-containing protein [Pseudomaricurvus alcaniphilus]
MHAFRSQAGAQGSFRGSSISKKAASTARQPHAGSLWHNIATGVLPARLAPASLSKAPGNLVQRLCAGCEEEQAAQNAGVQPKLNVGTVNDRYEQEADAVATQVAGSAPAAAQRKPATLPKSAAAQSPGASSRDSSPASRPGIASVQNIVAAPGAGTPLAAEVRNRVEPVLGADLSGVTVHNNVAAHTATAAINARAFTHQNHIFLGAEQSDRDVSLMAHELTHTVQQGGVSLASRAGARESDNSSTSGTGFSDSSPDNVKQGHSDSPSVQALFDTGCYRSSFAGVYETKRDFFFNRIGWVLIHPGECTSCEGQSVIDCCEPGDSYCAEE